MFTYARKKKLSGVLDNPVFGVERFEENKREQFLNPKQIKEFFTEIQDWKSEISHELQKPEDERTKKRLLRQMSELYLFEFLIRTGARIGETRKACWNDIDFNHIKGAVWHRPSHHTKSKKDSYLSLSISDKNFLLDWQQQPKQSESDLIFPGPSKGKLLTYPQVTWRELMNRLKLDNFKIHDLRHTNANLMLKRNINHYEIQQRLGHTSFKTTEKYIHSDKFNPTFDAASVIGDHMDAIKEGKEAEVVPIGKKDH